MKFILPTQHAPDKETRVGELKIYPNKRVSINEGSIFGHWDSMIIESSQQNWNLFNEWLTFHNIIFFDDHISLDWYESQNFDSDNKLIIEGDCCYLIDYSNISNKIYFSNVYQDTLNYEDLYKKYKSQSEENKALVRNYFNSIEVNRFKSTERDIRNDYFLRILVLFSIIESILGDNPKCSCDLTCTIHDKIDGHKHTLISQKEWIKKRLLEIISDTERVDEYFSVIWEIRQKIRHKTVHEGAISEARFIQQPEGEIIWDWTKTSKEWDKDSVALLNLKTQIKEIARNLLLNKIFDLNMFPQLHPLRSVTVTHKGDSGPHASV